MSRMPNAEKVRYTRLEPVTEGQCFYCPGFPFMDDTTPNHKAPAEVRATFRGEWTIVKVCKPCWHKLYNANWVNGAAGFGGQPGMMTMDQKRTVLGIGPASDMSKVIGFTFNRDQTLILPADTTLSDNFEYFTHGFKFSLDEVEMLQGAMSLIVHNMKPFLVEKAFRSAMAEGTLDIEREMAYRTVLRLDKTDEALF